MTSEDTFLSIMLGAFGIYALVLSWFAIPTEPRRRRRRS